MELQRALMDKEVELTRVKSDVGSNLRIADSEDLSHQRSNELLAQHEQRVQREAQSLAQQMHQKVGLCSGASRHRLTVLASYQGRNQSTATHACAERS